MDPLVWMVVLAVLGPIVGSAIGVLKIPTFFYICTIAFAIAIHNIPEGICTSAPYYHSTGKRLQSFMLLASTAIPILIGYITARHVLQQVSTYLVGFLISATAGLMIFITVDELIPQSCVGTNHQTIFSLVIGVVFVILLGGL